MISIFLGREGDLNCEVAPLPAPNPAHPPTTLAVRASQLALNSFYCGYAAWNSVAVNFKILLYLKFKNSKILLRRILPLEFRLWRRFLLRGKGATYSASLRSQETPPGLSLASLRSFCEALLFPFKTPNPWHALGADCVRVKFYNRGSLL